MGPIPVDKPKEETPFAHVPAPGIYEQPSATTPAGEIAFFGAMAQGLRNRHPVTRVTVLVFLLGFGLVGLFGVAVIFVSN